MKVQPCKRSELGLLRDFIITHFDEYAIPSVHFQKMKWPARLLSTLRGWLGQPRIAEAYWIVEAGKRVGFLNVAPEGEALFLHWLIIAKSARGRGMGLKVLNYLTETARKQGLSSIRLWVDSRNTPAIKFYEREGYSYTGRHKLRYKLALAREASPERWLRSLRQWFTGGALVVNLRSTLPVQRPTLLASGLTVEVSDVLGRETINELLDAVALQVPAKFVWLFSTVEQPAAFDALLSLEMLQMEAKLLPDPKA